MEDLKMGDVWKYPEHFSMFNITLIGDPIIRSNFTLEEAEAIRTAVVNHDRLTEESAQLKADKAELLEFIQSIPDDVADIFEWHEANNFCVDELIEKHKGQPMNNKPCVTVIEHDDDFIKLEVNGKELEVAKETGGVFTVDGDDYFLPCHATNGRIIFDGFTIYHQKGGDCYVE